MQRKATPATQQGQTDSEQKVFSRVNPTLWEQFETDLRRQDINIKLGYTRCVGYQDQKAISDLRPGLCIIEELMDKTKEKHPANIASCETFFFLNPHDRDEQNRFFEQNKHIIKTIENVYASPEYKSEDGDLSLSDYRESHHSAWEEALALYENLLKDTSVAKQMEKALKKDATRFAEKYGVIKEAAIASLKDELIFILTQVPGRISEDHSIAKIEKEPKTKTRCYLFHDGTSIPKSVKILFFHLNKIGLDRDSIVFLFYTYDHPKQKNEHLVGHKRRRSKGKDKPRNDHDGVTSSEPTVFDGDPQLFLPTPTPLISLPLQLQLVTQVALHQYAEKPDKAGQFIASILYNLCSYENQSQLQQLDLQYQQKLKNQQRKIEQLEELLEQKPSSTDNDHNVNNGLSASERSAPILQKHTSTKWQYRSKSESDVPALGSRYDTSSFFSQNGSSNESLTGARRLSSTDEEGQKRLPQKCVN